MKLQYTSGEFVYKGNTKDSARILYYEEQIDDNTRMIFYKDYDENNSKRKSYRQSIDEGEAGYTQENYDKYSDWRGVYVLQPVAGILHPRYSQSTRIAGRLRRTTATSRTMPIITI